MQTTTTDRIEEAAGFPEILELQQRMNRRATRVLWAGLLVPLFLSLLLLYFIYRISDGSNVPVGMPSENDRMARMEQSFILMTENLEEIQAAMLSINGYMQSISLDIQKLNEINTPLVSIDSNMQQLSSSIGRIESGISSLDRNTGELSSTMNTVANTLGQMTHDVNRMSKPRMMFPFD